MWTGPQPIVRHIPTYSGRDPQWYTDLRRQPTAGSTVIRHDVRKSSANSGKQWDPRTSGSAKTHQSGEKNQECFFPVSFIMGFDSAGFHFGDRVVSSSPPLHSCSTPEIPNVFR